MKEPIEKICRLTGRQFEISALEQELCRKFEVPLPTLEPTERLRRLYAFSNYINLFHGKCALTGEQILSIYRPEAPFPVYATPVWWSDVWDPADYGKNYDFSRPFFMQFAELMRVVPQGALSVTYTSLENCDYINGASFCKRCYLIFSGGHCEDCYFSFGIWRCRDCIDCNGIKDSELCYDCVEVTNCYQLRHGFNCKGCRESAFLWNCIGVSDCFGCANLRNKRFCYFNEQLSEAEYRSRMAGIAWDSYEEIEELRARFLAFVRTLPQPAIRGVQIENSTGDFINNCSNCESCFNCMELEDCAHCVRLEKAKDCMDVYAFGLDCEQMYCVTRGGFHSTNIKFSVLGYLSASNLEYCMWCPGCKDCFGCIGMRKREYCILNQQYTPEQYHALRARIIAQMSDPATPADLRYGEIFPYFCSPFPYNDSDAQVYLPISKESALGIGAAWVDDPPSEKSGRPFQITKQELKIYRERGYPLPQQDWRSRLLAREALKNPLELYRHTTNGGDFLSTFPPESGWQVLENEEYLRAI